MAEIRFTPLGKDSHGKSNLSEWRKNLKIYLSKHIGELADATLHRINGARVYILVMYDEVSYFAYYTFILRLIS